MGTSSCFSVGLLQKIPNKIFNTIKKSKEFIEYKDLVKKYVKNSSEEPPTEGEVKEEVEEVKDEVEEVKEGDKESEDEGISVEIIKYRRKEYFIIEGESPQYIYAIEDGELGDKVGEIEGKKKVFYKKNKK